MNEKQLIEAAQNVTPYGEYVFGFLVLVLVVAVIALWRQSLAANAEIKDVLKESIHTNLTMTEAVESLSKQVEGLNSQLIQARINKG